ncbi:E3 ubiquitin-protein ligase BOI-like [Abrus precatorius]|uniref:E3 ubiquitin-protein ligase BOI-like n=1 Tax=Abrus precatorius TaxID=3816 RepID=A0A8B8M1U0_ABRPR|nr:E3 ubiquitin-protein ligase BOI-like [Abrus precatorius]
MDLSRRLGIRSYAQFGKSPRFPNSQNVLPLWKDLEDHVALYSIQGNWDWVKIKRFLPSPICNSIALIELPVLSNNKGKGHYSCYSLSVKLDTFPPPQKQFKLNSDGSVFQALEKINAKKLLFQNDDYKVGSKGCTNSRKRKIEATGIVPSDRLSFQFHSPPLTQQTGLRLSLDDEQLQRLQLQQLHQQEQKLQQLHHQQNGCNSLSESLALQIKHQLSEIDQFLLVQSQLLRTALAEKRQRHYSELLAAAEESVARRLREKEAEVEKAKRWNAELEARAAQLSAEAQAWQAKVKAQEATAASLKAQLHNAAEERGKMLSCDADRQAEDAESAYVDPERLAMFGPRCRGCGDKMASVVVLPCRHLCICTQCDMHFRACPVCLTLTNSTLRVSLS